MSGTSAYFDAVGRDGEPAVWFKMCDGPFVAVARAAINSRSDNRQPLPLPLNRKDAGTERYEVGKLGDFRPRGTKDGMSVAIKASPTPACLEYTASWAARKAIVAAAYVASGQPARVAEAYVASGQRARVTAAAVASGQAAACQTARDNRQAAWDPSTRPSLPVQPGSHPSVHDLGAKRRLCRTIATSAGKTA